MQGSAPCALRSWAREFTAILSSAPPYSACLIDLSLKTKYQISWIANFRDPWITSESLLFCQPKWRRELDVRMEASCVQSADLGGPNRKFRLSARSGANMNSEYDPKAYWETRLKGGPALNTVGYLGLGLAYNKWLYHLRKDVLERALRRFPIVS